MGAGVLRSLTSLPRRVRWAWQRWSSASDRRFHDDLFRLQRWQPFTFAYPGYLTIRRFADLAEARLGDARAVVDLGCGPGEVTCELARRRPEVEFLGLDHSAVAIARAREHATALGLRNAAFRVGDIAHDRPGVRPDLVVMFDSFHHVPNPAAFVRHAASYANRFLLIEPSGHWLGGHQRTIDFDWIAASMDTVRARAVWQLGLEAPPAGTSTGALAATEGAKPVEFRYTLSDFEAFFQGFGLDVRGTLAGLDTYPPDPYASGPLREEFGRLAYEALVSIEDLLVARNLDLHAKHWVIHAEHGRPHARRSPDPPPARIRSAEPAQLQGAYDAEYVSYDGPRVARTGETVLGTVVVRNRSWRTWASETAGAPILLSYHWLDTRGRVVVADGVRTPLRCPLLPGEVRENALRIEAPPAAGLHTLVIDLVHEGVTWFSAAGTPPLRVGFRIAPAG